MERATILVLGHKGAQLDALYQQLDASFLECTLQVSHNPNDILPLLLQGKLACVLYSLLPHQVITQEHELLFPEWEPSLWNVLHSYLVPVVVVLPQENAQAACLYQKRGVIFCLFAGSLTGLQVNTLIHSVIASSGKPSEFAFSHVLYRYLAPIIQREDFCVTVADHNARILYASPGYERLSGFTMDQLRNKVLFDFGTAQGASVHKVWELIQRGESWRGLLEDQKASGEVYNSYSVIYPVIKDGVMTHFVMVSRDGDRIRQDFDARESLREQFQQGHRLKAIGTLAGGIAHDFNNILTPIFGFGTMAYDSLQGHPVQEDVGEILKAAERAKKLVQQVLSFSRHQDLDPSPVSLHILFKETILFLASSIPVRIKVVSHIDPSTPDVLADPAQIRQVILNLATNAVESFHSAPGVIEFVLQFFNASPEFRKMFPRLSDTVVQLSVNDTGCGIASENIHRVYDPFFTTKRGNDGSGLGLSVTHGIVAAHNGEMEILSEQGKGTKVNVYLPAARVNSSGAPIVTETFVGNGEHIIVVDDDETVIALCKRFLQKAGYTVSVYSDAEFLLSTLPLKTNAPQLLVTDFIMPQMNGIDLIQKVHLHYPSLPALLMSGFGEKIEQATLDVFAIADIIHKPLIPNKLLKLIHSVLN